MPPTKKRRVGQEKYPCYICSTDRVSSRFPDVNPTESCTHLINVCTECLRDYIDQQMSNNLFKGEIACPQCPELMKQSDIELVARKKTVARFIQLERRRVSESEPGWQWCLNSKCTSGQVHGETVSSEKVTAESTSKQEDAKIKDEVLPAQPFVCKSCEQSFCLSCTTSWHEGQSCEQFQKQHNQRLAREIAASVKTVSKIAKDCPNPKCKAPTQRDGGCPHMYCPQCSQDWCWNCNKIFDKMGGHCDCSRLAMQRNAAFRAAAMPRPVVQQGAVPAQDRFAPIGMPMMQPGTLGTAAVGPGPPH